MTPPWLKRKRVPKPPRSRRGDTTIHGATGGDETPSIADDGHDQAPASRGAARDTAGTPTPSSRDAATRSGDSLLDRAQQRSNPRLDPTRRESLAATLRLAAAQGHGSIADEVHRAIDLEGRTVLEIGCGSCWHAPFLLARGAAAYYGLDPRYDPHQRTIADRRSGASRPPDGPGAPSPLALGDFLGDFPDVHVATADARAAPWRAGTFDTVFLLTVSEHLDDVAAVLAAARELLAPGGHLYLTHGNYYCWNGHHLPPHAVADWDRDDDAHAAVADWEHVARPVDEARIDTLNFLRIHELAALLRRMFRIDRWELVPSDFAHGGGRLTPAIRARFPEYYAEELLTELVRCCCTRTEEPIDPLPAERPRRASDHIPFRADGRLTRLALTWCSREEGRCFLTRLPPGGDWERASLWEDGSQLGPGDSLHTDIRELGGGRFSIWGDYLYFSTSDDSDPMLTGRRYELRARPD